MSGMITLMMKEVKSQFLSPVAYAILTLFLFLNGLVFMLLFYGLSNSAMTGAEMDAPLVLTGNYAQWLSTILMFLLPLVTMGVFSEERKKGTHELLFTSPLTSVQIVLAKFFSTLAFVCTLFAGSIVILLPLFSCAPPDLKPLITVYLGLLLFAMGILSLGVFISTLTENQIISAVFTFVLVLVLFFMGNTEMEGVGGVRSILLYLSPASHLLDFLKGVISLSNVTYFVSMMLLGLFLTCRSLDSMRWRG